MVRHVRPPAAGGQPLTLAEGHALLLEQVAVRAGDVLTAIDGGGGLLGLQALVGYLRAEVLRQAADQEWLFPAHQPGEDIARRSASMCAALGHRGTRAGSLG